MYTKILIPLDGSEMAECVFLYLRWFIKVSHVHELVFLRIVEPFKAGHDVAGSVPPEERHHLEEDESGLAEKYLKKVTAEFESDKLKVNRVVLVGKPARTIGKYVADCQADLIIMATHGLSGIHRLVRGSVADEILHAAHVPVLLVRPGDRSPD